MDTSVSVIIPTFNAERLVTQAVRSVLAQTHCPLEITVIDDGSTDATREALRPYGGRLRYLAQENRGVYAARNRGIREARGTHVAFLDADDIWEPTKLARQVEILEKHPEFPVVHTDAALMDIDGRLLKASANPRRQSANGLVFEEFFLSNMAVMLLSTVVIRRDCFDKTGLFDERHRSVVDQLFFLRLSWHFPIFFIPEPLARYRVTPGSLSRRNVGQSIVLREELLREFIAEHVDYFSGRPDLLRKKWASFHLDAATRLWDARQYAASRRHFGLARSLSARALLRWCLTSLPEPLLRSVLRRSAAEPG
jgi:glycosyltransferase involved in cell wall biosynthesis